MAEGQDTIQQAVCQHYMGSESVLRLRPSCVRDGLKGSPKAKLPRRHDRQATYDIFFTYVTIVPVCLLRHLYSFRTAFKKFVALDVQARWETAYIFIAIISEHKQAQIWVTKDGFQQM